MRSVANTAEERADWVTDKHFLYFWFHQFNPTAAVLFWTHTQQCASSALWNHTFLYILLKKDQRSISFSRRFKILKINVPKSKCNSARYKPAYIVSNWVGRDVQTSPVPISCHCKVFQDQIHFSACPASVMGHPSSWAYLNHFPRGILTGHESKPCSSLLTLIKCNFCSIRTPLIKKKTT